MESIRSQYIVHFNPIVDMYVIVHTDNIYSYLEANFNFELGDDRITSCSSLKEVERWFETVEKECMI